jgi:hypothetical protein
MKYWRYWIGPLLILLLITLVVHYSSAQLSSPSLSYIPFPPAGITWSSSISGQGNGSTLKIANLSGDSSFWTYLDSGPSPLSSGPVGEQLAIGTGQNGPLVLGAGGLAASLEDVAGNTVVGLAATAVADTSGFLYIPRVSGQPIGIPAITYANSTPLRYDSTDNQLCAYNSSWSCFKPSLTAVSPSIGGGLLTLGSCTSAAAGATVVAGAQVGMRVTATPLSFPGLGATWYGYVSAANTVTVQVCALVALTPTATTFAIGVN